MNNEDKYIELKPYKGYGITKAIEFGVYDPLYGRIGTKKHIHYDIYEVGNPDWLIDSRPSLDEAKKLIDKWTN